MTSDWVELDFWAEQWAAVWTHFSHIVLVLLRRRCRRVL